VKLASNDNLPNKLAQLRPNKKYDKGSAYTVLARVCNSRKCSQLFSATVVAWRPRVLISFLSDSELSQACGP